MKYLTSILLFCFTLAAQAATVTPSDRVLNGVVIHSEPNSSSERLLVLAPDRSVEFVESVSRYYKVKLLDGGFGFVSKS